MWYTLFLLHHVVIISTLTKFFIEGKNDTSCSFLGKGLKVFLSFQCGSKIGESALEFYCLKSCIFLSFLTSFLLILYGCKTVKFMSCPLILIYRADEPECILQLYVLDLLKITFNAHFSDTS